MSFSQCNFNTRNVTNADVHYTGSCKKRNMRCHFVCIWVQSADCGKCGTELMVWPFGVCLCFLRNSSFAYAFTFHFQEIILLLCITLFFILLPINCIYIVEN